MMTVNGYPAYVNIDTHTSKPSQVQAKNNIATNSLRPIEPQNHVIDRDNQYRDYVTLSSRSQTAEISDTYDQLGSKAKQETKLQAVMQLILDKRSGIDREKLDKIEADIQDIANNDSLSQEEKEALIKLLEEKKTQLIQEFVDKNEQHQQQFAD